MSRDDLTLVCANSHIIETPDVYQCRVPAKWAEEVPRVVYVDGGAQWVFEDKVVPLWRNCAVAGMAPEDWVSGAIVTYDDQKTAPGALASVTTHAGFPSKVIP